MGRVGGGAARRRVPVWLAAGLAAALAGLAVYLPLARDRAAFESRERALTASLERSQADLAEVKQASLVSFPPPQTAVIALAGSGPQPGAWGCILWDQRRNEWVVYADRLQPAGPGKTYELWFITADERKVRAAIFDVDAAGRATTRVALPPGLGRVVLAAITDEPEGGVDEPTGSIHLAGEIKI
jgi:hypothetical protein